MGQFPRAAYRAMIGSTTNLGKGIVLMFFTIQADDQQKHSDLLDQMFSLRKRVFFDQLQWDVRVTGEQERDEYDELKPAYLVWTDPSRSQLYASIRLMPTTGPTLLYDVFRNTFPNEANLATPGIWEGTRACIDGDVISADHPEVDAARAFSMLVLATSECALAHGIHTIVSNYELQIKRIYRRAGAEFAEAGRADGYGRFPVCCGTLEISDPSITKMRQALGLSFPLYTKPKPVVSIRLQLLKSAA